MECPICLFNEESGINSFFTYGCGHYSCINCAGQYCKTNIDESNLEMKCCSVKSCSYLLSPKEIQLVSKLEVYEKYQRLTLIKALNKMRDVSWCPKCSTAVMADERGYSYARCSGCDFCFCNLCRKAWHNGKCHSREYRGGVVPFQNEIFNELKEKNRNLLLTVKRCPSCLVVIEKDGGCPSMKCGHCGTAFYWPKAVVPDEAKVLLKLAQQKEAQEKRRFSIEENEWLKELNRQRVARWKESTYGTMQCPNCHGRVEKIGTNNHISCPNCRERFCFECGSVARSTFHFIGKDACKQHTDEQEGKKLRNKKQNKRKNNQITFSECSDEEDEDEDFRY